MVMMKIPQWIRTAQRSIEGPLGAYLVRKNEESELKKSGLIRKTWNTKNKGDMQYLERDWTTETTETTSAKNKKTLVILYGLAQHMEEYAGLVNLLDLPSNEYRILIPECIGHGEDAFRVHASKEDHPSPVDIINHYEEFLEQLGLLQKQNEVALFGFSMGGAAAYHLQVRHPDLHTVMIAPAVEHVISKEYRDSFERGEKRHHTFADRTMLKHFLRDLGPLPSDEKKKSNFNPVPKFLLQGLVELRNHSVPDDNYWYHWLKHLNSLEGTLKEIAPSRDEMPHLTTNRTVFLLQGDYVCSYDRGVDFFAKSSCNVISIPDAGHMFTERGEVVLVELLPQIQEAIRGVFDHQSRTS